MVPLLRQLPSLCIVIIYLKVKCSHFSFVPIKTREGCLMKTYLSQENGNNEGKKSGVAIKASGTTI